MAGLVDKLGEPQVVIPAFSMPILGAKTTVTPNGQKLVLASYFDPSFVIYDVTFEGSGQPKVTLEKVISNETSAADDGGTPATLWPETAPSHSAPRAGSAQITPDGKTLLYLQLGGREIGRYDLVTAKVLPSLGNLEQRGEDFLILGDRRIATIENYPNCTIRVYEYPNASNDLKVVGKTHLNASMIYGLCVGSDVFVLAPECSDIPTGPGVYQLIEESPFTFSKLVKAEHFPSLPPTSRGLAPVCQANGKLSGFFVTTYDSRRDRKNLGTPSSLLYIPVEKK